MAKFSFFKDFNNTPDRLRTTYLDALIKELDQPTLERAMLAGRDAVISITENHDSPMYYPDAKYGYFEDEELFLMGLMSDEELKRFFTESPEYYDHEINGRLFKDHELCNNCKTNLPEPESLYCQDCFFKSNIKTREEK